jgi:acetyl esterase/lipase
MVGNQFSRDEWPQAIMNLPSTFPFRRCDVSRFVNALAAAVVALILIPPLQAADEPAFTRTQDVIYGRKFGTALTMDVFAPTKERNGAAVIFCVSGGWFSSHDNINPAFVTEFVKRGYTVFTVVHGSQPKFTVPEILQDMQRAVRFIRYKSKDYQIDPERFGITGASAGGHLSLMQGTAGDKGDPKAKDPVDRASSRVQAVACFFPATDLLNWGVPGHMLDTKTVRVQFKAALDFHEMDEKTRMFMRVADEKKYQAIIKQISPITHVTSDSSPTLIIHGDMDTLVPLQQAEVFAAKLKEAGVPVEVIVKKGAGHGWPTIGSDLPTLADWFDKYLAKKNPGSP